MNISAARLAAPRSIAPSALPAPGNSSHHASAVRSSAAPLHPLQPKSLFKRSLRHRKPSNCARLPPYIFGNIFRFSLWALYPEQFQRYSQGGAAQHARRCTKRFCKKRILFVVFLIRHHAEVLFRSAAPLLPMLLFLRICGLHEQAENEDM